MRYRIEITAKAEMDLREIYEYIAFTLLSPQHAIEQLARIEAQIKKLDSLPERFRLFEKEPWYSRGLRRVSVDNYIIFYLINEGVVTIIRVMYGGRDIDEQMKNVW